MRGKAYDAISYLFEKEFVIVAMTVNEIFDLQIVRGSVDGEIFMDCT